MGWVGSTPETTRWLKAPAGDCPLASYPATESIARLAEKV